MAAYTVRDTLPHKVLYLALTRSTRRWIRPIMDWPAALNFLSIVFDSRVPV